jgi:protease-4
MWLTLLKTKFWVIDADFAMRAEQHVREAFMHRHDVRLPSADRVLIKETDALDERGKLTTLVAASDIFAADGKPRANGPSMNIALIPLKGVVSKDPQPCDATPTTKDVMSWISQANADPNVSAIVLVVDSPGGSVDGTEELAQAVQLSQKPVVAWVDGLVASAAYWISSQASEIIINQKTTAWAGSIGVISTIMNVQEQLAKEGIAITMVRDSTSYDKAKLNPYETIDPSVLADHIATLDSIKSTFVSYVKAGRGDKLSSNDVFTGKLYNGQDAVKNGLVDKVGTLQDAVNAAARLASKKQAQPNSNSKTNSQNDMKVNLKSATVLAALLGFEAKDEEVELNAEHIATIEAHVTSQAKAVSDAQALLATAETAKTDAEAKAEENKVELTTLRSWKANAEALNKPKEDVSNSAGLTPKKQAKHNAEAMERFGIQS